MTGQEQIGCCSCPVFLNAKRLEMIDTGIRLGSNNRFCYIYEEELTKCGVPLSVKILFDQNGKVTIPANSSPSRKIQIKSDLSTT